MRKLWLLLPFIFISCLNAQISVKFVWFKTVTADSYQLQVSTDSTFATSVFQTAGIADTSQVVTGLAYNTKYYWRVNATNLGGTGPWSEVWYFTTAPQIPVAVLLSYPLRGAVGVR